MEFNFFRMRCDMIHWCSAAPHAWERNIVTNRRTFVFSQATRCSQSSASICVHANQTWIIQIAVIVCWSAYRRNPSHGGGQRKFSVFSFHRAHHTAWGRPIQRRARACRLVRIFFSFCSFAYLRNRNRRRIKKDNFLEIRLDYNAQTFRSRNVKINSENWRMK